MRHRRDPVDLLAAVSQLVLVGAPVVLLGAPEEDSRGMAVDSGCGRSVSYLEAPDGIYGMVADRGVDRADSRGRGGEPHHRLRV